MPSARYDDMPTSSARSALPSDTTTTPQAPLRASSASPRHALGLGGASLSTSSVGAPRTAPASSGTLSTSASAVRTTTAVRASGRITAPQPKLASASTPYGTAHGTPKSSAPSTPKPAAAALPPLSPTRSAVSSPTPMSPKRYMTSPAVASPPAAAATPSPGVVRRHGPVAQLLAVPGTASPAGSAWSSTGATHGSPGGSELSDDTTRARAGSTEPQALPSSLQPSALPQGADMSSPGPASQGGGTAWRVSLLETDVSRQRSHVRKNRTGGFLFYSYFNY